MHRGFGENGDMPTENMLHNRILGCLEAGAVGDAVGFGQKCWHYQTIRRRLGKVAEPRVRENGPQLRPIVTTIYYTDDTVMKHMLCEAIFGRANFGRDCDTIAGLAGALAGALHGPSDVPEAWLDAVFSACPQPDVRDYAGSLTKLLVQRLRDIRRHADEILAMSCTPEPAATQSMVMSALASSCTSGPAGNGASPVVAGDVADPPSPPGCAGAGNGLAFRKMSAKTASEGDASRSRLNVSAANARSPEKCRTKPSTTQASRLSGF